MLERHSLSSGPLDALLNENQMKNRNVGSHLVLYCDIALDTVLAFHYPHESEHL